MQNPRPTSQEAGGKREHRPTLSKFGGTTFLEHIPVQKGDPTNPPNHVSGFYKTITSAQRFEWQFRVAMAFKEIPDHLCYWITYTYAVEPPTWEAARRDIKKQLQRLQNYKRRVLVPEHRQHAEFCNERGGDFPINGDEKLHYLIVEEEGAEKGRKHFHALVWFPYKIPIDLFKDKLLKWPYGFQKVMPLRTKEKMGLAIYIAKYATKAQGRTKCSSNLGLTTTTTLLSISAYKRLTLMAPNLAQKLLRRLCLTANYPTSRKMTYLISRVSSSITSLPLPVLSNPRVTGTKNGSLLVSDGSTSVNYQADAALSEIRYSLVRDAVRAIRAVAAGPFLSGSALPGLLTCGRPNPLTLSTQLEKGKDTYLWFTKSNYPRCARNRARLANVQVAEPRGTPE